MSKLCLENVQFLNQNEFDLIANECYNLGSIFPLNESFSIKQIISTVIKKMKELIEKIKNMFLTLINKYKNNKIKYKIEANKIREEIRNRKNGVKDDEIDESAKVFTINEYFLSDKGISDKITNEMTKIHGNIYDIFHSIYGILKDENNIPEKYERKYNTLDDCSQALIGKPYAELDEYISSIAGNEIKVAVTFNDNHHGNNMEIYRSKFRDAEAFLSIGYKNLRNYFDQYFDEIMKINYDQNDDKYRTVIQEIFADTTYIYNQYIVYISSLVKLLDKYIKFARKMLDSAAYDTDSSGIKYIYEYFEYKRVY